MTIIQAQPLKQFGISGPASALDNEVPIFDGITGKKIKAATGITSPSSGRLDLAEIRAAGDLKLQADAQGDVVLFGDTDVGDAVNGKRLYIHRKAAEGDAYARMYMNSYNNLLFEVNGNAAIFDISGGSPFRFGRSASAGTNFEFGSVNSGANTGFRYQGYLTAPATYKYAEFKVNDTTDNFELARQDSNIGYFDIQMPTIITGGNVGIGTTASSAKLDINSDIIRLRTAKTPASAGAAGNQGDECWDTNYYYRCVATNTWKRTALTTW